MKRLLIPIMALVASSIEGGDRLPGRPYSTRSEVITQHGMAATSHPLATNVAIDILKKGGSAVDAALAANATLTLMEPTGSGLGGDLFAIVWDNATGQLYGLNASGRSPGTLTAAEFKKRNLNHVPNRGPLSVSVPGAVDGWFELHGRFGKLPIGEILEPAIEYAEAGFPLTEVIADAWAASRSLTSNPNFATTFFPGGRAPATGEIFRNPDLAGSLRLIAEQGRDAFYKGRIAQTIDAYCKRVGCFLTAADLANHRSEWVEPVSVNYRGYDVWELPPNGQGIAALQMLTILEAFDLKSMGHNSAAYLHHLIEAKKIAFEDRARFYGDPEFSNLPVAELISKEYGAERRKLLNPERASRRLAAGNPRLESGDTIYLTVADGDGNMVSLIQSNYSGFGSGLVPDRTGFGLQNRGALFTLEEDHPNSYAPAKRPFHTIIPAFITRDGKPYISFGLMGGDMQPQGHVQIVCNIIDFGMNLQQAGDAARFRHFGSSSPTGSLMTDGGQVALESGVAMAVQRQLVGMGHRLTIRNGGFGGYQAILLDAVNKVYRGASESRKDGMASGY